MHEPKQHYEKECAHCGAMVSYDYECQESGHRENSDLICPRCGYVMRQSMLMEYSNIRLSKGERDD